MASRRLWTGFESKAQEAETPEWRAGTSPTGQPSNCPYDQGRITQTPDATLRPMVYSKSVGGETMNVYIDTEQVKGLIKEALAELLAERAYGVYDLGAKVRRDVPLLGTIRADGIDRLMDRAEIFRLLD
jgi:hypothetical protein